jgi:hypothetical protein
MQPHRRLPAHIYLQVEKTRCADLVGFSNDFQRDTSARAFARFPDLARDMGTTR